MNIVEQIKTRDASTLQSGMGLMRVAELQAIARVATIMNAQSYVSMGCGEGYDFLSLRENYRRVPSIGFDIGVVRPDNVYPEVEFHNEYIFQTGVLKFRDQIHDKISEFLRRNLRRNSRPALFYTDNGRKLEELRELIPHVRSGDVMGTHDWGIDGFTSAGTYTEVFEHECKFLYAAGFKLFEQIEPWIHDHKCIQRFWIKT
jgi:hypothetical protein